MPFTIIFIALLLITSPVQADSRRVEVYPVSQSFVDVAAGDTLGEIVQQLLPNNPSRHRRLMQEIVELNPDAFTNNNPDKLKSNIRLWLPGHLPASLQAADRKKYIIEEFSWGYIQRVR